MVQDFPDDANFLSSDEKKRVLRRLAADQQASAKRESFNMKYFWASVKDYKTYLFSIIYMGAAMPLYAFALFVPTIIQELVSASLFTSLSSLLTLCLGFVFRHFFY